MSHCRSRLLAAATCLPSVWRDRFFVLYAIALSTLTIPAAIAAEPAAPVREIDRWLHEELFSKSLEVKLAPRCDDETFLRRVYLDTVGENPTPGEVTKFLLDPATDKREQTITRLLDDPRYGVNWARYWRDVIVARRSAAELQLAAAVSGPLESFLADSLNANKPWDQIARAFVEAEGVVSERGETALIVVHMGQTANVAAETSRVFLGIQIQCAECHDHPTDRWKRQQFHEFAAFFPRLGLQRERTEDGRANLRVASFDNGPIARPANGQQGGREHFMPDLKRPNDRGTMMSPVFFVSGQSLETGATDRERRESLGRWLTARENPWFAKALVNRVWMELVGQGFCEPIDDLGPERPCVAPQTWERLAADFAANGHDLKRLYRTILSSDAYQRVSRPKATGDDMPFTANVPQPLRADALLDVLSGAIGFSFGDSRPMGREGGLQFAAGPRGQFIQLFGYDPSVRRDEVTNTLPQVLALMNSPFLQRPLTAAVNSWLTRLLAQTRNDDDAVTELYLRCFAREPNEQELAICREHLRTATSRAAGFEDLFWALLNSQELRFRN